MITFSTGFFLGLGLLLVPSAHAVPHHSSSPERKAAFATARAACARWNRIKLTGYCRAETAAAVRARCLAILPYLREPYRSRWRRNVLRDVRALGGASHRYTQVDPYLAAFPICRLTADELQNLSDASSIGYGWDGSHIDGEVMNNTGIRITAITLLYSIFDDQSHLVVRRTVLVPVDIAPWCSGHYRVIIPDLPAMVKEWISNGKETDFLKEYLHLHTCDYTSQIVASWGRRLE